MSALCHVLFCEVCEGPNFDVSQKHLLRREWLVGYVKRGKRRCFEASGCSWVGEKGVAVFWTASGKTPYYNTVLAFATGDRLHEIRKREALT